MTEDVSDSLYQGICGENTAKKFNIGRAAQDEYAIRSYQLSKAAVEGGLLKDEIVPVEIPQKKGLYTCADPEGGGGGGPDPPGKLQKYMVP